MKSDLWKVTVGNHTFELNQADIDDFDCLVKNGLEFHVIQESKGYNVQILQIDENSKNQHISVNGNPYMVSISDQLDQMLSTMGMSLNAKSRIKEVKAPMPGLILDVLVKEGQEIKIGDHLLILEAMKMENILKSEGEGIIKSIEVRKGDSVEKGHLILIME